MPAVLLERVRDAQLQLAGIDLRGHADETRAAIYAIRTALYRADDILARRAGETLPLRTSP